MNTFDCIMEDSAGNVVGLSGDRRGLLKLDPGDVCPRSELRSRAVVLMAKYGLNLSDLSDGLKASLAGSPSTPTPPPA